MHKKILNGQITLEASLLIAICVAALLAMKVYLGRAIQGSMRTNIDTFSDDQSDKEYYLRKESSAATTVGYEFVNPSTSIKAISGENLAGASEAENKWNWAHQADKENEILQIKGWGTYSK